MSTILDRVDSMQDQINELEGYRREAIGIAEAIKDKIEMIEQGKDVLYREYMRRRPIGDQWDYWIDRLDRGRYRLYYDLSGEYKIVHWPELSKADREAISIRLIWAQPDDLPESPLAEELLEAVKKKLGKD